MTWHELVAAEPLLGELLREAQAHRDIGQVFCANAVWYGYGERRGLRQRMNQLVGNSRRGHPVLGSRAAHGVAYQTLYESLPDCADGCACSNIMKAVTSIPGVMTMVVVESPDGSGR